MAVGYIDKDFIEEGPFRAVFYNIALDDSFVLENVKLWLGWEGEVAYYMASGVEGTDADGETIYEFNADTRRARKLMSDGSLETKTVTVEDDEGNETTEERPKYRTLDTERLYIAEVSYTSTAVTAIRSTGAKAELEIRESINIL